MQGVSVLLSRLEGPVNLGFIARAMANTGFSSLSYSGDVPKDHEDVKKFSVHAYDIIENSNQCSDFDELTKKNDIIIGFSPRDPFSNDTLPFDHFKDYVKDSLESGMTVGLLFGNEAHGLDNNELSACTRRVSLPTSSDYSSMNLAQAVLVSLWEIKDINQQINTSKKYAGRENLKILLDRIHDHLDIIDFFNEQNPDLIWQEIRQAFESKNFTQRETELLISLFGKSIIRYKYLLKSLEK